jgi:hypothetical protein
MDLNLSARNRRARERWRHRLCRYLQGTLLQAHFGTRDHVNSYVQSSLHSTTIYVKVLLIYSWKLSTFLFSSSFIPHFSLFMLPVSMPTESASCTKTTKILAELQNNALNQTRQTSSISHIWARLYYKHL